MARKLMTSRITRPKAVPNANKRGPSGEKISRKQANFAKKVSKKCNASAKGKKKITK